jgi:hypothetical protein
VHRSYSGTQPRSVAKETVFIKLGKFSEPLQTWKADFFLFVIFVIMGPPQPGDLIFTTTKQQNRMITRQQLQHQAATWGTT